MIRAEGGALIEAFEEKEIVALGWDRILDLSLVTSRDQVRDLYSSAYPDHTAGKQTNAIAMLFKFRVQVSQDDRVVTYDPEQRQYLVGDVISDYMFDPNLLLHYPHIRKVHWIGKISRDTLRVEAKNTLGSTLTLFSINQDVAADLEGCSDGTAHHL
jgi:restriction system protein